MTDTTNTTEYYSGVELRRGDVPPRVIADRINAIAATVSASADRVAAMMERARLLNR